MSMDPKPAPQGMRLWVRILLVVSLAFNLLVFGAVAGMAIKGGPWEHAHSPRQVVDAAVGPLTRALTKEDRRAIGRQIRKEGRADGLTRRAHREALERMLVLLQSTPFDSEAFGAELAGSVTGLQTRMSRASETLVLHLSQMSDADRAAYAERVKDAMAQKRQ